MEQRNRVVIGHKIREIPDYFFRLRKTMKIPELMMATPKQKVTNNEKSNGGSINVVEASATLTSFSFADTLIIKKVVK